MLLLNSPVVAEKKTTLTPMKWCIYTTQIAFLILRFTYSADLHLVSLMENPAPSNTSEIAQTGMQKQGSSGKYYRHWLHFNTAAPLHIGLPWGWQDEPGELALGKEISMPIWNTGDLGFKKNCPQLWVFTHTLF